MRQHSRLGLPQEVQCYFIVCVKEIDQSYSNFRMGSDVSFSLLTNCDIPARRIFQSRWQETGFDDSGIILESFEYLEKGLIVSDEVQDMTVLYNRQCLNHLPGTKGNNKPSFRNKKQPQFKEFLSLHASIFLRRYSSIPISRSMTPLRRNLLIRQLDE